MVSSKHQETPLIYNLKISSVGPGRVTGQDAVHEPNNMDLAMKLHYLRGVYYFKPQAFQGMTIMSIKETMFNWLNHCYVPCGRLRRSDSGRPYIKCNDCGVRLVEAQCDKSLDEWLVDNNKDDINHKALVPNQAIGPELPFSPLVFIQITKFKCGGTSVGLSWAHILGDAFFAVKFMNMWSLTITGQKLAQPLNIAQLNTDKGPRTFMDDPISMKRVDPVGDNWITPNNHKMATFSFQVSSTQLNNLQSKICEQKNNHEIPPFESLCAVIWLAVAKVRDGLRESEPKVVTICKSDPFKLKKGSSNMNQVISVVEANVKVSEASPKELGLLMVNEATDEVTKIEEAMKKDNGLPDFEIYGANLTFVNLEDAPLYALEVKGQKPVFVSYMIDGVGDEGVVLVLPGPVGEGEIEEGSQGKIVTITMLENQLLELKYVLKKDWSIA